MDIKEVKEEVLEFSSQNERECFMKDLAKTVKIETVTSSSNIKPELDSTCSQNKEHNLLRFNETINESEIETKMDIQEEDWWLEREDSHINDDYMKDETYEDSYSISPRSLYKGVTSCTPDLFSREYLGSDISFKINKDGSECESDRKCRSAKCVVTDISSIETSVCSEVSDDRKIIMVEHIKPYKCNICNKAFTELSNLEAHKLIHEGIKPHKCNVCNKTFVQLSDLKRHNLIHEGIKPHKCNICIQAFAQLSHLKRHSFTHEGIKPHKCGICTKAFTRLSHLQTHKLIHDGIKPYKCNICGKAFTKLSYFKNHKLIHEGIKPYKCNICNMTFTQLSHLQRHKLIHEGIKPHKCNVCDRAFTALSNLKRHKLIHEGTKPHNCSICNKAFTTLSHLKRHKLIHKDTLV